jgi:hypothetical protein
MEISQLKIGRCANATDRLPTVTTLGVFFDAIRSDWYGPQVRYVRDCYANGDDEAAKEAKCRLPCAMPSGSFRVRANDGLVKYSGLICFDLDDLEDIPEAVDHIGAIPWVAGWFISPSGVGLKVWARTNQTDPKTHWAAFKTGQRFFAGLGYTVDPSCADLARLCYVSHDPAAVLRTAEPLMVDLTFGEAPRPAPALPVGVDAGDGMRLALLMLDKLGEVRGKKHGGEGRHAGVWTACNIGYDCGIPQEAWWPILEVWNEANVIPAWKPKEVKSLLERSYRSRSTVKPFGACALLAGILDD